MIKSFSDLGRYRLTIDESWQHDRKRDKSDIVWYEQVVCGKHAFIYLFSADTLAYYSARPLAAKNKFALFREKGINARLDMMDGEALIYFPFADWETAFKVLGAKKKRKGNPEISSLGHGHRFKSKIHG